MSEVDTFSASAATREAHAMPALEDIITTATAFPSSAEKTGYAPLPAIEETRRSYLDALIDHLIYVKRSPGKDGKEIRVYKFRTMAKDADTYLSSMLNDERNLNHQGKLLDDQRITKTGRFLRRFWFDELPQLYNILRGDMKLVGVRPMQEEFWDTYPSDVKEKALRQRPGLLGVNYAIPQKEGAEHVEVLRDYLEEYGKHPFLTDTKYFFKIWHNILANGERSR
jgi:lipopolysaccharide/colanic/teichoic acid biosynthesis glycosyltransferase